VPGAGAVVVGRIPALAVGEVGWERQLGQHDIMGNSIEASRGGVAHQRGLSTVVVTQRRRSSTLGGRSGGWHRWSG
jgi:hypothetical protein